MTCVVGFVQNDEVFLGGDSVGSDAYGRSSIYENAKVFKHPNGYVMGYAGSYLLGQILEYTVFPYPRPGVGMSFMVTEFIPVLRQAMLAHGLEANKQNGTILENGAALVGFGSKLFLVQDNLSVLQSMTSPAMLSIGSGQDVALGSLHTSFALKEDLSPSDRIRMAMYAAQAFNAYVRLPISIVSSKG